MVLLIPAEVINTVHKLAIACKKYKGIVFTDKHGNIINEDNYKNDDTTHFMMPMTPQESMMTPQECFMSQLKNFTKTMVSYTKQ